MGTNYYAIRKASDELKSRMRKALDENDFIKLEQLIPRQIHIGKSSVGWAFLFNHNDWKYFKTLDELKEFLQSSQIIDEYGVECPYGEFWGLVCYKQDGCKDLTWNGVPIAEIHFDLYFSNATEFS